MYRAPAPYTIKLNKSKKWLVLHLPDASELSPKFRGTAGERGPCPLLLRAWLQMRQEQIDWEGPDPGVVGKAAASGEAWEPAPPAIRREQGSQPPPFPCHPAPPRVCQHWLPISRPGHFSHSLPALWSCHQTMAATSQPVRPQLCPCPPQTRALACPGLMGVAVHLGT